MPGRRKQGARTGDRSSFIRLRLSDAEKAFLDKKCASLGASISYMIRLALTERGLLPVSSSTEPKSPRKPKK